MFRLILFTILILNYIDLIAQNYTQFASNEMQYWKLRGRLIGVENNKDIYNGFMTIGDAAGMSIPGASRHPTYKRDVYYFNPTASGSNCPYQTIDGIQVYGEYDITGNLKPGYSPLIDPRDGKEVKGLLMFSDNSIIKIGYYLGVLATEWALLRREGASTLQTEKEIYYALAALDRLDLNAENLYQYPGSTATPSINGFLMRNDVDEKFQLNTTGKNIDLVTSSIACMDDGHENWTESNANIKTGNAMSQDEVQPYCHLLPLPLPGDESNPNCS